MKQLFSMLFAITLVFMMGLTVFASEEANDFTDDSLTQDIGANYTAGAEAQTAGNIYSVSIEWTSIGTLEYQGANGGTYTWNPNTLKYELSGNSEASWTDTSVQIDISNSSNTAIVVQATYADKDDDSAQTSMSNWVDNETQIVIDSAAVDGNGDDIAYTDTTAQGTEQTAQITGTVTATGSISANSNSVGTITITLSEFVETVWSFSGSNVTGVEVGTETDLVIPPTTPNGVTVTGISQLAFKNCTKMTSIEIPDTVTTIGGEAFSTCTSLTSIIIPASVTKIETTAFAGCTNLSSVEILGNITSIESDTFMNCTNLESIIIPSGVTKISNSAFYNSGLVSVTIPKSVTTIHPDAFYKCNKLTDIYYEGTEEEWGAINKAEADIPEGVEVHYEYTN